MDKAKKDQSTEDKILNAALKVFSKNGYAAARMDDIAKTAGINRALLHYYFRSKEKIFEIIFSQRLKDFFSGIVAILISEMSVEEKIRALVDHDISTILKHPDIPMFVISEINYNPERFVEFVNSVGIPKEQLIGIFQAQVDKEVKAGIIKPIEAKQLMLNTMSMAIYPFLAKPIVMTMLMMDEEKFIKMMEKRKEELADFIINCIKA